MLVAQQRVQRARRVEQLLSRAPPPGSGHASGPSVGERLVLLELAGAQQLHPRGLLGAELAQAQLAAVVEADEQPRGAVAGPRRLVV